MSVPARGAQPRKPLINPAETGWVLHFLLFASLPDSLLPLPHNLVCRFSPSCILEETPRPPKPDQRRLLAPEYSQRPTRPRGSIWPAGPAAAFQGHRPPSRHRRWVRVPAPGWSPPLVSLCSLVGLGLPRDFLVDAEWSGDPARSASGSGRRDPPPAEPADPRPSRRRGLPRSVLNPLGAKARTSVGSGQGEQRL